MPRIFLAGPMFSGADLAAQSRLRTVMVKAGYDTYLAQLDGLEQRSLVELMLKPGVASPEFEKAVATLQRIGWCHEMYQIFISDGLVFNMNGRVPDEGAVVEAATAFAFGIPVVTFKDTTISMWGAGDNPMVAALDRTWKPTKRLGDLPAAMKKALAARSKGYKYEPPQHLRESIEFGKEIAPKVKTLVANMKVAARKGELATTLAAIHSDVGSMRKLVSALLAL